ncbi:MAG: Mur ligase domain-containing protein [Bacilli bacterium]
MKYYCIGIKGSGMATLANILFDLGNEVSGYDDVKENKFTQEGLDKRGIKIYYGENHLIDKDTIVTYSAAFSQNHPEIKLVKSLGLTIKSYNDIIGDISREFKTICICGTHGKTTTTSLISHILKNTIGCNYFIGDGSGYASKSNTLFALESCEFNKHFLAYSPYVTVITNIELEHTECYNGIKDIRDTFKVFANKSSNYILGCGDDKNIRKIKFDKEVLYYGFNDDNDYVIRDLKSTLLGETFKVYNNDKLLIDTFIPLVGKHMVLDAVAAIIVCNKEGVSFEDINKLLSNFVNAKNRFNEEVYKNNIIINDYAHHPTEIRVTIEAAREKYPNKKVIAIFKPNTYSRTESFLDMYVKSLDLADYSYVTPIESNRESISEYPNIRSENIVNKLKHGELLTNVDVLDKYENSILVFMSCADITHLIDEYKLTK